MACVVADRKEWRKKEIEGAYVHSFSFGEKGHKLLLRVHVGSMHSQFAAGELHVQHRVLVHIMHLAYLSFLHQRDQPREQEQHLVLPHSALLENLSRCSYRYTTRLSRNQAHIW